MTPRYTHNDASAILVGTYQKFDLYYSPPFNKYTYKMLHIRWSDKPDDFAYEPIKDGKSFSTPVFRAAYKCAKLKGVIK